MQKQRTTSEELGVFLSPVIVCLSVCLFVFSLQNGFQSRLNHVKMPSLHHRHGANGGVRRLRLDHRTFGLGVTALLAPGRITKIKELLELKAAPQHPPGLNVIKYNAWATGEDSNVHRCKWLLSGRRPVRSRGRIGT